MNKIYNSNEYSMKSGKATVCKSDAIATSAGNFGPIIQRELNRWSQFSKHKLIFFSKVKIKKNAFNKK